MIHYHGTPIGGSRVDVARFLAGRHALVSFYRPDDMPAVLECCQSFCLDNGAFSLWRSNGGDVNFEGYLEWVRKYCQHPSFDWCLIPDKIDGDEAENKALVEKWSAAAPRINSVPVYHMHEPLSYLEWLTSNPNFRMVALGSSGQWASVGTDSWWKRMRKIMNVVCDEQGRPKIKLHGLRMLDPAVFTRLPLSSADSTNAAVNCGSLSRFGSYLPPTASQRAEVIAERIEAHNSAHIWETETQHDLFELNAQ